MDHIPAHFSEIQCLGAFDGAELPEKAQRNFLFFRCIYQRHPSIAEVLRANAVLDANGVPSRLSPSGKSRKPSSLRGGLQP
jgi:hypothetical protein